MSRTALVTGAGRRIGRVLARALARRGFDVALHCLSSIAPALAAAAEIRALGRRTAVLVADLARENEVRGLVPAAVAALGPLELLVNNASVFLEDPADRERAVWDRQLEVNLRAPVVLARDFAGQLPEGSEGLIVNLLDSRLARPTANYLSYTVSKAGLAAATRVMAKAFAPRIRVNAIAPGPVLPAPGMEAERFARIVRATPLGRGPTPEEIAAALGFFLEAPSVTGETLLVDGGQHMG